MPLSGHSPASKTLTVTDEGAGEDAGAGAAGDSG
jgi:hypothetical protein